MEEVHDSVAVPDPFTVLGLIGLHVSPAGTVSVKLMVPVNWFREVRVIVVESGVPTFAGAGPAVEMAKSRTWNVMVAL